VTPPNGFQVDEPTLDTFAQRLDLLARDLPSARGYTSSHVDGGQPNDKWILSGANAKVDDLRRSVLRVLTDLEDVTKGSSAMVRITAKAYRDADAATDRRLRAIDEIPSGEDPYAPQPRCWVPGHPPDWHVTDTLTDPQAPHPMPPLGQEMLSFQSKISIAWGLNWLINEICGVNPFEETAAWVSGDFEQFARAADTLAHLGEFFSAFAPSCMTLAKTWRRSHWRCIT
jgi:hypothetical protein